MRVRAWTGLLAVTCLAAGLIGPPSAAAATPPGTLITGMTVGYSTNNADPDNHPASAAIDGDPSTWWSSGSYYGGASVLNVDLGAYYWVSGIEVLVKVQAWYNISLWGEQVGHSNGTGLGWWPGPLVDGTLLQTAVTWQPYPMRFISVELDPQATGYVGGVYEIRVYGTPALHYDFAGFFAPVDNNTLNVAKAGSAVPVKFSLGGDQGLDIFAAGYPKAVRISCATGEPADVVDEYVVASNSGLMYDAGAGRYQYNWKTTKGVAGCFRLDLGLKDGSVHTADFQLR